MLQQYVLAALLAWIVLPAIQTPEEVALDNITEWGLKGDLVDGPFRGVWLLHGKDSVLLFDTSHCKKWDPPSGTMICDVGTGQGAIFGNGTMAGEESHYIASAMMMRLLGAMRYSVMLTVDREHTQAKVDCVLGLAPYPFESVPRMIQELFFTALLERGDVATRGYWSLPAGVSLSGALVRNNYAAGVDKVPESGYLMLPVLSSSGSVNAENLALAKAKLGVGNVALRRKNTLLSGIF